jgi:RNA polymerase sigma factor (sigma-70 family)
MQRRTTVIELFSMFIQFSADRFNGWVHDRRLKIEMENRLAQGDNASQPEGFWVLYWYKRWHEQTHRGARAHLNAYLQEPCYWATKTITQRFSNGQWTLADCFQVAIAHTDRILKGYRPDYGSTLRSYARTVFSNLIRDQLRQQQDINICSDWGLLRRLSQIQLHQALVSAGLTETEPEILAWRCFKLVYTPDPRRSVKALPTPTLEQFTQITERYNQLRLQGSCTLPQLTVEALVANLNQSIQAVRAYLFPAVTSLNDTPFDQGSKTPIDDLSSDETPMDWLLVAESYAEQQQRVQQIQVVLMAAISTLAPVDQTLLRLYYREALTQTEIAHQLQIKQYQVSRKLGRIRQQLLTAVACWSQERLHISLDSTVLASMSDVIHEWLQQRYQSEAEVGDELSLR